MEKSRIPMSTQSLSLYRLCAGIQNPERLAENAGLLGDYSSVEITNNTATFKAQNSEVELTFLDASGVAGSDSKLPQIMAFILWKIYNALWYKGSLREVTFKLDELVEKGIYSDYCTAKRGFEDIASFLCGVGIGAKGAEAIEQCFGNPERDTVFARYSLFNCFERTRGTVRIEVNQSLDWEKILEPYAETSPVVFSLPNQTFKFAMSVLEKLPLEKSDKPFDISLRFVMSRTNLPSETTKPERDVKKPLREAIETINEHSKELGFGIVPHYDESIKFSRMLDNGYITVKPNNTMWRYE